MKWDSELYNDKHHFVSEYGKSLLSFVPDEPKQSILDVGCGTGTLTHELSLKAQKIVGIDDSYEMIERARQTYPNLEFDVMDALSMDFHEDWDVVFSNAVFHWINDHELLMKNIHQALKPSGILVCEFGGFGNIKRIEDGFKQAMREVGFDYTSKFHFPTVTEFEKLLKQRGFSVALIETYDRPTILEDGQLGLYHWARQVFKNELDTLSIENQEHVLKVLQQNTQDDLWHGTSWVADYVRLRVVASK